jgi:glucokinase
VSDVLVAVDVGGTTMKAAVVGLDGRPWSVATAPTAHGTETSATDGLSELLVRMVATARALGGSPIAAGVVTPGMVDEDSGVVGFAANLGLRDVPLRSLLEGRLGLPVAVGHDVRAAGLAESLLGAARDVDDFVLVPVGTGIAAAVVSGGRPVRGAAFAAGELGHIPVFPDGALCSCGQRGCLEVYASGVGLTRRYRAAGGVSANDAAEVVALLGRDPLADAAWGDAVRALGLGLATATLLFDPALIVLGGGLSAAGDVLIEPVAAALQDRLAWRSAPALAASPLGSSGGRIGAAVLALRAVGQGERAASWTAASATHPARA